MSILLFKIILVLLLFTPVLFMIYIVYFDHIKKCTLKDFILIRFKNKKSIRNHLLVHYKENYNFLGLNVEDSQKLLKCKLTDLEFYIFATEKINWIKKTTKEKEIEINKRKISIHDYSNKLSFEEKEINELCIKRELNKEKDLELTKEIINKRKEVKRLKKIIRKKNAEIKRLEKLITNLEGDLFNLEISKTMLKNSSKQKFNVS